MKNTLIILIISLFTMTVGCRQSDSKKLNSPKNIQDGISVSTLPEEGMMEVVISEIIDSIKTGFYPNRHSLLIYKNDNLVSEEYFPGQDYNWGRDIGIIMHSDTVLHDMRSISKSVVSACIGIAIAQGKIKGVDQPIFDFFKDYEQHNNDGREKLTVKHLLTMTSGLEWNEDVPYNNPLNSEIQMDESGDGVGFVLSRKLTAIPGTEWKYNGGTTEVLATIINRATGKNVHEYAKEYIFEPMGIVRSQWTNSTGTNNPAAASGLRLRSRDMLKFGILYHNEGMWDGKQIVPKEWVNESLKSSIDRSDGGGYGYQFWILNYEIQGETLTIPAAIGNGDQRIYFDKKNNLLVATTAGNYNMWDIKNNASTVLRKIYESFEFSTP